MNFNNLRTNNNNHDKKLTETTDQDKKLQMAVRLPSFLLVVKWYTLWQNIIKYDNVDNNI